MHRKLSTICSIAAVMTLWMPANAQRLLSLEDCRSMALESNREIQEALISVDMAKYDKKTAVANYFPEISAKGAYIYNNIDINLVSEEQSQALRGMGTSVKGSLDGTMEQLMAAIKANPAAAMEYMQSPMWQTVIGALSQAEVSQALNGIGTSIDEALHPDFHNLYLGTVSLKQPVFVGGKIINSNKMASLAEKLSEVELEGRREEVLAAVDQAYWQIVSVSAKKRLAEEYAELLHSLEHDIHISVLEGVATASDELQIKVKANEADMMKLRVSNGLNLAKMLLCKEVGLPLDEEIVLADENSDKFDVPAVLEIKDYESIWSDRYETRALALAGDIYKTKAKVVAADMYPQLAVTANYLLTNPDFSNGISNKFSGNFYAGVVGSMPLFHGLETRQKVHKAKAESRIYQSKYEGAKELIKLQVTQARNQNTEARERLNMAKDNLAAAEENLRTATIGFEEGLISATSVLAAHTAWLQAKTDEIEASVDLRCQNLEMQRAQGVK